MQVSIETTSGLQRCMTIGVPAAEVEQKVTVEIKKLSKGRKIDGFRPGKIPPHVAKKMFGKQARYEAIYQQMQQSFFQAVQQENVKLAGMPSFEPTVDEEGKDLEFKATFEVYPEVTLGSFGDVKVEKLTAEVTDEEMDTMLSNLQKQQAEWNESEEAAVEGDQAVIDFEGFIDGEAFEGGKATGYTLNLGSGSMIPGFEEGVVGLKAGDETTLDITFPEDYHKEELKGKPSQFKIKVNTVKKAALPELNEEFFKKFDIETADLAEFKAEIRKNMERELKRALRTLNKQAVINGLVEQNDIEVPAALIDQEIDRLRQQAVQQFGGGQPIDASMLPAELFKDQAEKRVTVGLLMNAAIEGAEMKVDEDKVTDLIEEVASSYEDPDQVRDYYRNNPQQKQQIEALALEEQLVDAILAEAAITEKAATYEEVIRLANQNQQR